MATQQIEFLHDGCISAAINNWYFMTILFLSSLIGTDWEHLNKTSGRSGTILVLRLIKERLTMLTINVRLPWNQKLQI